MFMLSCISCIHPGCELRNAQSPQGCSGGIQGRFYGLMLVAFRVTRGLKESEYVGPLNRVWCFYGVC